MAISGKFYSARCYGDKLFMKVIKGSAPNCLKFAVHLGEPKPKLHRVTILVGKNLPVELGFGSSCSWWAATVVTHIPGGMTEQQDVLTDQNGHPVNHVECTTHSGLAAPTGPP